MTYLDSVTIALRHAYDLDLPDDLLPLTITSEATMLAGLESDHLGSAAWV